MTRTDARRIAKDFNSPWLAQYFKDSDGKWIVRISVDSGHCVFIRELSDVEAARAIIDSVE